MTFYAIRVHALNQAEPDRNFALLLHTDLLEIIAKELALDESLSFLIDLIR